MLNLAAIILATITFALIPACAYSMRVDIAQQIADEDNACS